MPSDGRTYREQMLREVGAALDPARVHFLGALSHAQYLCVLQVSRVHVYLTYPFVLSWSMLEALSAGCLVVGSRTAETYISRILNKLGFSSRVQIATWAVEKGLVAKDDSQGE